MDILVIDDDEALCRSLQLHLEGNGHTIQCAHRVEDGKGLFDENGCDLVFIDLVLPDGSGLDFLRHVHETSPQSIAVMITGTQDTKATIEAMRLGAFDYIRKPLDLDVIELTVEKVRRELASKPSKRVARLGDYVDQPNEIVGAHPAIIEVIKQIGVLSQNRVPVLITGESGTGKELVARALHETSSPSQPFVAVNCAAMVPTLLESELFGHVKGAFTGAERDKMGRLEFAAKGSLFFDEIGDMSMDLQAKLLRALQERCFEAVGSVDSRPFDARVIAATNRNLKDMVAEKTFREDLFYRLEVSTIHVPPLRDRKDDIPLLAEHLLARISRDIQKSVKAIEEDALSRLRGHDWPGNVRELENVLTRAALVTRGDVVTDGVIAESLNADTAPVAQGPVKTLREAEREHVLNALNATGWNITRTAAALDISPTTLRKKIGDYALSPPLG